MYKEISDELWARIEPLLQFSQRTRPGGSPPRPLRSLFNGIFYLLKTGCQWDMIPKCYGSKSTLHEHYQRWVKAGVFERIFGLNIKEYDAAWGIGWVHQAMDGGIVQAPTRHPGGSRAAEDGLGRNPTDRGRQGSKLHLHVEQSGIPLGIEVVGANVHDSRLVSSTLETLIIERPAVTPQSAQHLSLDKGYDYKRVEREVQDHHYTAHIRRIGEEKQDATGEKKHPARRWVVERTIAWLKGFRALRTRYICKGKNYLALVHLACAIIVFRALHPKSTFA